MQKKLNNENLGVYENDDDFNEAEDWEEPGETFSVKTNEEQENPEEDEDENEDDEEDEED